MNLQESLVRTYGVLMERWNESGKAREENAFGGALARRLHHNFYDSLAGRPFESGEAMVDQLDQIVITRGLRIGRVVQRAVAVIKGTTLTEREAEAGYSYYRLFLQNIGDEKVNFIKDEGSRGVQFLAKCKEEGLDSRRVEEVRNAFTNPGNEVV